MILSGLMSSWMLKWAVNFVSETSTTWVEGKGEQSHTPDTGLRRHHLV